MNYFELTDKEKEAMTRAMEIYLYNKRGKGEGEMLKTLIDLINRLEIKINSKFHQFS